jgi:putative PIG3 family NAD(P)H quinone oxidoreductase
VVTDGVRAILVSGDSGDLVWGEVPTPEPGADAALVQIHATAVNRADLLQRRGFYPPPPGEPDILGMEAAGVVVAKGERVEKWQIGDRVCCLLGGGGYAEYVAVHGDMLLPIPTHLDFIQAAAIPEVFYTAFITLFLEGDLRANERALVHAGGSGVGTAAIQLARQRGAQVFVTAGSDDKLARCAELGADAGINYKTEDFAERVAKLTGGEGVDVVLDCVGGSYLERNVGALRAKGRLVIIGLMGGAKAEINLALLVGKRLRVLGSVLRARPLAEKIAITEAFKTEVLPLLASGQVKPIVDAVYPITEAAQAHEYVAANRNFGKVVLRVVP